VQQLEQQLEQPMAQNMVAAPEAEAVVFVLAAP